MSKQKCINKNLRKCLSLRFKDRNTKINVYSFKSEYCRMRIKTKLIVLIRKNLTETNSNLIILFIPYDLPDDIRQKYDYLAKYLQREFGIKSEVRHRNSVYNEYGIYVCRE